MAFDPTKLGYTAIDPTKETSPSSGSFDPSKLGYSPLSDKIRMDIASEQDNQTPGQRKAQALKNFGKGLIGSEIGLGQDIARTADIQGKQSEEQRKQSESTINALLQHARALSPGDPRRTKLLEMANELGTGSVENINEANSSISTTGQVLGHAGGVALDIVSAGSYGKLASGAKSGELLTTARKVATPIVEQGVRKTLGQTLKTIGKETAIKTAEGAGLGYAYDVAGNLQQGEIGKEAFKPGLGTVIGGSIPVVIGGVRAGVAITKDAAPRFINSLIKPKQADFSYGKDPGRTVSEMGITGNNLKDFEHNITTAKNDIGQKLGDIYSSPKNANIRIDVSSDIAKIDDAIKEAAKGGKNNQTIVNQLQNIKDSLLYEHGINDSGDIVKSIPQPIKESILSHVTSAEQILEAVQQRGKTLSPTEMAELIDRVRINAADQLVHQGQEAIASEIRNIDISKVRTPGALKKIFLDVVAEGMPPRDLSTLNPQEAFEFKKIISEATQFTGRPSDDKKVNSILKEIYGGVKEKLNTNLSVNNPEITKLNQQFADLTSAELATRNRDMIVKRSNLISLPATEAAVGGAVISAIVSGGAAIPAILGGASALAVEKAFESPAVKTRVAAWLGNQTPGVISAFLAENPQIAPLMRRSFPIISSKLSKQSD